MLKTFGVILRMRNEFTIVHLLLLLLLLLLGEEESV